MNLNVLKKAALWVAFCVLIMAMGEHAAMLVFPAVVGLLMAFPGPDPERPRLVRLAPWYWGLNWAAAAVIGGARLAGRELVQGELSPESWELVVVLVTSPVLMYTLVRRLPVFRAALVVSTALSLFGLAHDYFGGAGGTGELVQWLVFSVLDLVATVYLWFTGLKAPTSTRPRTRRSSR